MTSKPIYFCVYRITNLVEKKHYYGYKSSSIHPSKVIGITYFSSMTKADGKAFIKDQKENPQNYKYKIVQIFGSKEEALAREIRLHNKFDVAVNSKFYNKRKQTSIGFDGTGIMLSDSTRKAQSDGKRGKLWYTNTVTHETRKFYPGTELENFIKGRYVNTLSLERMKTGNIGKIWFHNPKTKENKIFRISEVPIGWIKGRILNYTEETLEIIRNNSKIQWNELKKDEEKLNAYYEKKKITDLAQKYMYELEAIHLMGFETEYDFYIQLMYDVNVSNLCITELNKKYLYDRPNIKYPILSRFLQYYNLSPIKGKTGPKSKLQ